MSSRGTPSPAPAPFDGAPGESPSPTPAAALVAELCELAAHLDSHGHDSDELQPLYAASDLIAPGAGNGSGAAGTLKGPRRAGGRAGGGGGPALREPSPVLAEPMWEAADRAPLRPAMRAVEPRRWAATMPGGAWETAVAAVEPGGRPWSPAAAMVAIAAPAGRRPTEAEPEEERSSWVMSAVSAVALLVAIAVFVVSRLDLASTTGPPPVRAFAVTELHAVAGAGTDVGSAPNQDHFPANVALIRVRATYVGARGGDLLEFRLSQPPGAVTRQATLLNRSFTVDSEAGDVTVTVSPPTGQPFLPGIYTLEATRNSVVVASAIFTIDPVGPVTPTGH